MSLSNKLFKINFKLKKKKWKWLKKSNINNLITSKDYLIFNRSRKKIYYNITSSQDFPLITTLLERFKLHDVWEVIDNLNKILTKMDKKNTGISFYI